MLTVREKERSKLKKIKLKFTSFFFKKKKNQMAKTTAPTPEHGPWKSPPGTGRPMDFSAVI